MYKLLLSWRYLKTRFIALASIVSVTLGVATLIVVNSVMCGFVDQMKSRLHGILSDVEISAPLLSEIPYPEQHVRIVKQLLGEDVEAVTCVVRNPALLSFEFHGRQWTQQVMLMGIDDETFSKVTDFQPNLINEVKKASFSFKLEEEGYDALFEEAGWPFRRRKVENLRELEKLQTEQSSLYDLQAAQYLAQNQPTLFDQPPLSESDSFQGVENQNVPFEQDNLVFTPLPDSPPDINKIHAAAASPPAGLVSESPAHRQPTVASGQAIEKFSPFDPHAHLRPPVRPEDMFDPMEDQHVGLILGIAISSRKFAHEDGTITEMYMVRPGDDVQIMFPTVGKNAQPVSENCTIVDFYSSNMYEYDSSFAFVPLGELQKMRGMVDPLTGDGSVSTIQIKLNEGSDLAAARDKLIAAFPPSDYPYDIRTWLDTQAPLLSAVSMELTILNILLFLIIGVAGFGILATFFMIVVEKTKDIGILKALERPAVGSCQFSWAMACHWVRLVPGPGSHWDCCF